MKKTLLILLVMTAGLSGCYVAPYRDHDDSYRRDREHRDDHDHGRAHDDRDDGRGMRPHDH